MTYRVERILDKDRLEKLWVQVQPLFDKCIKKAMHGEFGAFDLKQRALEGKAHIFVAVDEQDVVQLAVAIEFVMYPKLNVANVMALGGSHLLEHSDSFFDGVKWWLKLSGIKVLDAMVSDSMYKILTHKFGFARVYHHVRLQLGD